MPRFFSGEGCVSENGPGVVELSVFFGGELILAEDPGFVIVGDDGGWSVGFVPIGYFPTAADAVGTYEVTATCFDAATDEVLVDYEPATFEVTAPVTPPTVPESPEAPAAVPVAVEPSFTG